MFICGRYQTLPHINILLVKELRKEVNTELKN